MADEQWPENFGVVGGLTPEEEQAYANAKDIRWVMSLDEHGFTLADDHGEIRLSCDAARPTLEWQRVVAKKLSAYIDRRVDYSQDVQDAAAADARERMLKQRDEWWPMVRCQKCGHECRLNACCRSSYGTYCPKCSGDVTSTRSPTWASERSE